MVPIRGPWVAFLSASRAPTQLGNLHLARIAGAALRRLLRPLPISAPVHTRPARHCQPGHGLDLGAVRDPAVILAPSRFLRIPDQIGARDMVVMPDLGPAHPGEEFLGPVRVDPGTGAVELAVIDPGDREARCQVIPLSVGRRTPQGRAVPIVTCIYARINQPADNL